MARQPGPKHWRRTVSGPIAPLLATCARIERAQRTLAVQLPDDLASICRVCSVCDTDLTLAVPSPAWAARLRYLERRLLKSLRRAPELAQLTSITLRVDPVLFQRKRMPDKRRELPASAARLLEALADDTQAASRGSPAVERQRPDRGGPTGSSRVQDGRIKEARRSRRPADDALAEGLRRLARRARRPETPD